MVEALIIVSLFLYFSTREPSSKMALLQSVISGIPKNWISNVNNVCRLCSGKELLVYVYVIYLHIYVEFFPKTRFLNLALTL